MTNQMTPTSEVEINPAQEQMINTLLQVPHRTLGPMVDTLTAAMVEDPYTASRFCAYLLSVPTATAIDDHRQAAAIALLRSPYANYREAGRTALLGNSIYPKTFPAKLSGLPPYQILRVEKFIRSEYVLYLGNTEVERLPAWDLSARYTIPAVPPKREGETNSAWHRRIKSLKVARLEKETPEQRKARSQYQHLKKWATRLNKIRAKDEKRTHWSWTAKTERGLALPVELTVDNFRVERVANFHRPTRLMKNIMRDYLQALEARPAWWDSVMNLNRDDLREAYKANHLPRSPRAQAILFDNTPPEDSSAAVIKSIAAEPDPVKRAEMVIAADLPITVASSFLPNSPTSWVALIAVMTPDQAANARAWVEASGILEMPEVKAAYLDLIGRATKSAAKLYGRKSAQGKDAQVQAQMVAAADKSVATDKRRITQYVDLVVDQSGSMEVTLAYAAMFAGYLAPYIDAKRLLVIAFNNAVRRVEAAQHSLSGWKAAMSELKANSGTNIEGAVVWLDRHHKQNGTTPGEIVLLSDGGENPDSHAAKRIHELFPRVPVTIFGMGAWEPPMKGMRRNDRAWNPEFAQSFRKLGHEVRLFTPQSPTDYNLFDQAVSVLGGPNKFQTIMDTPLPKRILETE